jgi:alpha-amylase
MKNICLYFQVHQPFRLRPFHFLDIGKVHHYYDDQTNHLNMRNVAQKCYLPANRLMLDLIRKYGDKFKISYSISGTALDQFELYAPDVLQSFVELADTGCVEFLAETNNHSFSALVSQTEFKKQVEAYRLRIEELFGKKPEVFRNTELIYSDQIGALVHSMNFKAMLTEGADHILGWKSPNYLYCAGSDPELRLLLKNFWLSDDIAFWFSQNNWNRSPFPDSKFVNWLNEMPEKEEIVNLFIDYETFGGEQWGGDGIFELLHELPKNLFSSSSFRFTTPSDAISSLKPVARLSMPEPVSWTDEERNLSAWLGSDLQADAFQSLYSMESKICNCKDTRILRDWKLLQTSDHFYSICRKGASFPDEAFINYMNVLADFEERVCRHLCRSRKESKQLAKVNNGNSVYSVKLINTGKTTKTQPQVRRNYN